VATQHPYPERFRSCILVVRTRRVEGRRASEWQKHGAALGGRFGTRLTKRRGAAGRGQGAVLTTTLSCKSRVGLKLVWYCRNACLTLEVVLIISVSATSCAIVLTERGWAMGTQGPSPLPMLQKRPVKRNEGLLDTSLGGWACNRGHGERRGGGAEKKSSPWRTPVWPPQKGGQ
jgi:hypothetical protein